MSSLSQTAKYIKKHSRHLTGNWCASLMFMAEALEIASVLLEVSSVIQRSTEPAGTISEPAVLRDAQPQILPGAMVKDDDYSVEEG
jgi:hypothetical protein